MNSLTILIVSTAFTSLVIGLALYVALVRKGTTHWSYSTNQIAWLLIALFPALIIFSFFPQSSITGKILSFSVGGAVALFVFVWWYGAKSAIKAVEIDELNNTIRDLRADLGECEESKKSEPNPLPHQVFSYPLKKRKRKKIGLITGDIEGVKSVDIWVNSENSNMQMSRYYEGTISGTIRYLGARKDFGGEVTEDLIGNELRAKMAGKTSVEPTIVIVTDPGELGKTHNVKKIFHVACVRGVRGVPGKSYHPVENIELCVTKALELADSVTIRELGCKSILFPILGAGAAKGGLSKIAERLLTRAIHYLEFTENSSVEAVYFLAWTDLEVEACKRILSTCEKVAESN